MLHLPPGKQAAAAKVVPSTGVPTPVPAPLLILILISTIQPVAMNMYVPAMAAMQVDLSTSASHMQLTLSAFLAATAVGQLVVGPFSDMLGRRPVLIAGLAVFLLGTLICIFAPDVEMLIIGRIVQGLGGCTGLVLSRAIVRDVHGAAASASMIGYVTMGMALAPLITPAIGGVLYEISSWRVIFAFMGVVGVIGFLAAVLRLRETHTAQVGHNVFRRFRREIVELVGIGEFWHVAFTLAALSSAFFSFVAGGAFVAAEVFDLGASEYGLYFILIVMGYILGNFCTGRFGARLGILRMILIGNAVGLLGVLIAVALALGGSQSPFSLFAPMMLVGVGNGFSLPSSLAACVNVRPHLAGTASGVAGAFQVGSGAVASVVVGLLIDSALWPNTVWPVLLPITFGAVTAFSLALGLGFKKNRSF